MTSDLEALRDILISSINNIVDVCVKARKDFPSLHRPYHSSEFSPDGIRNHPDVADNITLAVAAASQLIATLQPPVTNLMNSAFRMTLPVCLGIAEATNVAEIIRNADSNGMHVEDIAKKAGVDPKKLERVLRFLASNHWFREVKERTFAHNLLSSLLDTGKDITENFAATKHLGTSGFAAIAGFGADELMPAVAHFKDVMLDPETAFSEEVDQCGFQRAFNTHLTKWDYYELPENRYRCDRYNYVMAGSSSMHPEAILAGYSWETIPDGLLVDVGSGTGHVPLEVAKKYPNIQVVVEDRESVIRQAEKYWRQHLPSHVENGKVHFIAADFLKDQPQLPGVPDVFLLRWILHDWPDKYAIKLLKNLRKIALVGKTKLVVVESVMKYACESKGIPITETGASPKPVPTPLLPNLGGANSLSYAIDIVVSSNLNAGERTIQGYISILEDAGWSFSYIQRLPGSNMLWHSIVADPRPDYNTSAY